MKHYIQIQIVKAEQSFRYKLGEEYQFCTEIEDHMEFIEDGYMVLHSTGYKIWYPKDVFNSIFKVANNADYDLIKWTKQDNNSVGVQVWSSLIGWTTNAFCTSKG